MVLDSISSWLSFHVLATNRLTAADILAGLIPSVSLYVHGFSAHLDEEVRKACIEHVPELTIVRHVVICCSSCYVTGRHA